MTSPPSRPPGADPAGPGGPAGRALARLGACRAGLPGRALDPLPEPVREGLLRAVATALAAGADAAQAEVRAALDALEAAHWSRNPAPGLGG